MEKRSDGAAKGHIAYRSTKKLRSQFARTESLQSAADYSFFTHHPPDIFRREATSLRPQSGTHVVAVCGIIDAEQSANPLRNGPLISDFWYLRMILRGYAHRQRWIASGDVTIKKLVEKYGRRHKYHGNRRSASQSMLSVLEPWVDSVPGEGLTEEDGEDNEVVFTEARSLRERFLQVVEQEALQAEATGGKLLLIVIGSGHWQLGGYTMGADENKLTITNLRDILSRASMKQAADAPKSELPETTLMVPSLLTDRWQIYPEAHLFDIRFEVRNREHVTGSFLIYPSAKKIIENMSIGHDFKDPEYCNKTLLMGVLQGHLPLIWKRLAGDPEAFYYRQITPKTVLQFSSLRALYHTFAFPPDDDDRDYSVWEDDWTAQHPRERERLGPSLRDICRDVKARVMLKEHIKKKDRIWRPTSGENLQGMMTRTAEYALLAVCGPEAEEIKLGTPWKAVFNILDLEAKLLSFSELQEHWLHLEHLVQTIVFSERMVLDILRWSDSHLDYSEIPRRGWHLRLGQGSSTGSKDPFPRKFIYDDLLDAYDLGRYWTTEEHRRWGWSPVNWIRRALEAAVDITNAKEDFEQIFHQISYRLEDTMKDTCNSIRVLPIMRKLRHRLERHSQVQGLWSSGFRPHEVRDHVDGMDRDLDEQDHAQVCGWRSYKDPSHLCRLGTDAASDRRVHARQRATRNEWQGLDPDLDVISGTTFEVDGDDETIPQTSKPKRRSSVRFDENLTQFREIPGRNNGGEDEEVLLLEAVGDSGGEDSDEDWELDPTQDLEDKKSTMPVRRRRSSMSSKIAAVKDKLSVKFSKKKRRGHSGPPPAVSQVQQPFQFPPVDAHGGQPPLSLPVVTPSQEIPLALPMMFAAKQSDETKEASQSLLTSKTDPVEFDFNCTANANPWSCFKAEPEEGSDNLKKNHSLAGDLAGQL